MITYMIVVNDGGELKSVSQAELDEEFMEGGYSFDPMGTADVVAAALNKILDRRAIETGEYEPEDNDTPIEVRGGYGEQG